jgi:cupin 2 domain-containing protein
VLLRGSAVLRFEDEPQPLALDPGDWIEIAAHRRHRVEETSGSEATLWLAVHWDQP